MKKVYVNLRDAEFKMKYVEADQFYIFFRNIKFIVPFGHKMRPISELISNKFWNF